MGFTKTIAAPITGGFPCAVSAVRISGGMTAAILAEVFRSKKNVIKNPRMLIYGEILDGGKTVMDRGLAVYMPAPESYTGEDTAEIYCHGSRVVISELLRAIYKNGGAPAEPGEFTKRAFLNQKLDLIQAEAVVDLIDSKTKSAMKNAARQLRGVFGDKIRSVRSDLLDMVSRFYAIIDFPDEDVDESGVGEDLKTLKKAYDELSRLAGSFSQGRFLRDGVRCAIIGRPNVGKSSILNALLGFERSIVTESPGTTRDTIEESYVLGDVVLNFIDSAGIRETSDTIEALGVRRSHELLEDADLILAVVDGSSHLTSDDHKIFEKTARKPTILVVNKTDMESKIDIGSLEASFKHICEISAKEKTGMDHLESTIKKVLELDHISCDGETLTNPRHAAVCENARGALLKAYEDHARGVTPDMVLLSVENAVSLLGELTGDTTKEDIVERIFSRFCYGK